MPPRDSPRSQLLRRWQQHMVATSGVRKRRPHPKKASATPKVPSTRSSLPKRARAKLEINSPSKSCPTCGCICNTNNTTARQTWTEEQLETWRTQIGGDYSFRFPDIEHRWSDDTGRVYSYYSPKEVDQWDDDGEEIGKTSLQLYSDDKEASGVLGFFECGRRGGILTVNKAARPLFPDEPVPFEWWGGRLNGAWRGGGEITITEDFSVKCIFFDMGEDIVECEGEKYNMGDESNRESAFNITPGVNFLI